MERLSVFDIFKIGVGPSSSHTLGPWRAAQQFVKLLHNQNNFEITETIQVHLFGSLAKTGKGHGTDIAVQLGLCGDDPETFDVNAITSKIQSIADSQKLHLDNKRIIIFTPAVDIVFHFDRNLPQHPNALTFVAHISSGEIISETYYSVGGGFVEKEGETTSSSSINLNLKYPIDSAEDLLNHCSENNIHVVDVILENEKAWRPESETLAGVLKIWHVMRDCIFRGCQTGGTLPGGLNVVRRAAYLNNKLLKGQTYSDFKEWLEDIKIGGNDFKYILDWVSCFALAVNEENASFGRVVTAPTNGAAGVIPAVLLYYITFCDGNDEEKIIRFLLTASEIGCIFKKGSTISAAMGGCQAEIGVSSAMAAAALTESLGGSVEQVLMAAEIAMEHHLGLTCDPIRGLVQVPCIERNTMGAIKAITAAQLALQGNPSHALVSLDSVIRTMWQTALDMNSKYKETSEGGLAVQVPLGLSEC